MTPRPPTIWIVSPVYLDVEGFLEVRRRARERLEAELAGRFGEIRFVAVDDTGGLDPQIERLRGHDDVRVIEPPFNLGHQRTLVFALRSLADEIAPDDYVATLDSDGEDRPEDLPRLLAPLLARAGDVRAVAVAQRTRRSESTTFKLLYFFFRILFRTLTGLVVRSGNFAAYRGWLVRHVLFHPHFDLCYSSSLLSLNLEIDFVPLARGQRWFGRSRMSFARLLTHGISMLLPFTERIAVRALVVAATGFGLTALALLAVAALALTGEAVPPPWLRWGALVLNLISFVALGNALLLFAAFVQTRGALLRGLETERRERA